MMATYKQQKTMMVKKKTGWMNLTAFKATNLQVSSGVRGSQM